MDKLETFQRNDPRKLFEMANQLNERSFFAIFLNETQFKIINHILSLDNFEIWTNFLEGNCYISYLQPEDKNDKPETPNTNENNESAGGERIQNNSSDRDTPTLNNNDKKNDSNKETMQAELETPETLFPEGAEMIKKLALHVRYLLWEKAIDFYYNSKVLDESNNILDEVSDDYQLIDSLDNIVDEKASNESEKKEAVEKLKVREIEDDYDDDDEDEDEDEDNNDKPNTTDLANNNSNSSESRLAYNSNEQLVLEIPLSIFKTKQQETNGTQDRISNSLSADGNSSSNNFGVIKQLEENNNEDQDKLLQEFNKVYHNFEYDRETLLKRRKLEKSDMQLESNKSNKGDNASDSKSATHIDMNLGAASTSLQHLLSTIQSKRNKVPLNDHELRTLFMDVRKNRGKWANDDRVGQEELYEACEKVVTELRGYTEHSTFFLNKVSKREAPNYGLIIKKPMDLNTVLKKLKNLAYNSKQEFVDDLMLIWSNCLTYNADPAHFIRAHAIAMQKKTIKLIPTIPDIRIRNRAEVEKEEEVENGKRDEEEDSLGGKSMKKGRKRSRQDEIKAEAEAETPNSPSPAGTPFLASEVNSVRENTPAATDNGNVSNDEEEEEEEDTDNINGTATGISGMVDGDDEEFDPELQAWRTLTAKSRANYCAQRADLFDENGHLKSDVPAICRKSNEMSNFNEYLNNKEVISKSKSLLENDEPYLLEYDVAGGIPGIAYCGVDKETEETYENKLVDIYLQQTSGDASKIKSDFVLSTNSGLNKVYFENICEIQEIRKICFKISLIRQMQTQQFVHHTQMKQPEIQTLKEIDVDAASKLPNHDASTGDVQFSVFRRNIAKIAMQTGFETTQQAAINTLTQVAERYLGNLIKSLKLHSETTSDNRLPPREILLLSLLENGVDRPDDLYTFVQERVVKQQGKLKDLRIKLSNFLKDLLRPGLENFNEKSFEDNSEQFMTGDFSNGIGDDFFGFKELGLDKEFKMLTSSIPIYLLHSRLHNQFTTGGGTAQRNKYEDLQEYETEKIHGNEVDKQIGILIPFYQTLYEKSQTFYVKTQKKKGESMELPPDNIFILTEDEDLPQKQRNVRPKLPPTGRISSIKKKIIANSFFLPEEEELQKQEMELKAKEEAEAAAAAAAAAAAEQPVATTPQEGQPKQKTAKELEKERKKAEKLAKFNAKKAKQAAEANNKPKKDQQKDDKKTKKANTPTTKIPEFVDKTVPGDKKILISLDDESFKAYNPKNVESSWYSWWEKQGFFEPELTANGEIKKEGCFSIPCPPPNVTGALHIGHALTVSIQDTLIRWNRMQGKTTLFIPGFDHAGIATQSVVEKQIWAKEQKTRHDYGREKFIEKVWEWKEEYHQRIKNQFKKLGSSYDWSREKFTLNPDLSQAVTEAFVRMHEDGTIYRASRLVNWSVKLNTAISNLEVDNKTIPGKTLLSVPGYESKIEFGTLTSFSYPVVDSETNEKLTVATTRPETIFGDTAVAVHPKDPRYTHLHGKFVQHPFLDRKLPIICDAETVDMEFGTGAVKITPAHDQNDYNTGKRNNLEFINIYTDDGLLNENCGPEWKGMKRFDARYKVIEQLKQKGLFVDQKDNEMTIPVCSRSGDIIEPLLKPQWYVDQKQMAKDAIEVVKRGEIVINPKTSEAEYFQWLENIQDWCISRQLWWGHRCPVYFVNIENEQIHDKLDNNYWVAGRTEEEAFKKAQEKFPNKKFTLEQDEDVLDTWFSSGLWPISTLGWPNETKDMELFNPMSMLETGWDILFFWVSRMILMSIKLTGKVPFKEVFCHSLVRDAQGRKMSKSLGNVVDPLDVINGIPLQGLHDKLLTGNLDPRELKKATEGQKLSYPNGIPECGTDALRFALCAYSTGGRDINLDILRVEGYRKFCNKIYQATKFVLGRLGQDYIPPTTSELTGKESLVEKWILHKLSHAAKLTNESLEARNFGDATNHIYNFWYDLCDVYIENSKSLIQDGTPEQKKSAQDTLYTCIDGALRLIHPFMPFITEEMWQRLPRREPEIIGNLKTIMKAPYPVYKSEFDDIKSLEAYNLVLDITKGARSLLSQYNILKNGQVYVETNNEEIYKIANDQQDSIVSLIKGVEKITVVKILDQVPSGCALQAIGPECTVHVLVKGQIDLDAEIAKVEKKLSNVLEQKKKTDESISKFTEKTKPEAKDSAYKRLEKQTAEIEGYEQTIAILEKLKL